MCLNKFWYHHPWTLNRLITLNFKLFPLRDAGIANLIFKGKVLSPLTRFPWIESERGAKKDRQSVWRSLSSPKSRFFSPAWTVQSLLPLSNVSSLSPLPPSNTCYEEGDSMMWIVEVFSPLPCSCYCYGVNAFFALALFSLARKKTCVLSNVFLSIFLFSPSLISLPLHLSSWKERVKKLWKVYG